MFFGPKVTSISNDELRRELDTGSAVLVDVREPEEFSAGHVPGAINLPLGTLPGSAAKLDHDARTIVICQTGHRSVTASRRLMKDGFSDVRNVKGGTSAWGGRLEP
jgi:rhodanese-related sulfurtransferase